jgi:hypothetical protein
MQLALFVALFASVLPGLALACPAIGVRRDAIAGKSKKAFRGAGG